MLLARNGKQKRMTERIKLPKQEKIRKFREKEADKYLGILEADSIKQTEIKKKH